MSPPRAVQLLLFSARATYTSLPKAYNRASLRILPQAEISGCGIDASVHATEEAAGRLGVAWSSPLLVLYRDTDGAVRNLPRSAFRKLVADGTVTAETPVFDVSLTTLGQLRSGAFEKPAGASWHARVFRIPQPAASHNALAEPGA